MGHIEKILNRRIYLCMQDTFARLSGQACVTRIRVSCIKLKLDEPVYRSEAYTLLTKPSSQVPLK